MDKNKDENISGGVTDGADKIKTFPIVGIGASAGGLQAITELLATLPVDTGMAFVFIQHLDPTHESSLVPILGRATALPVIEVTHGTTVEPDHFYIIPPNKTMVFEGGRLNLSARPEKPIQHSPIDSFFLSLAENAQQASIGIILSGTASDGALGLKAIKRIGGLCFAQDATAEFQSMPKAAISEGAVDLVMSPTEMAGELARLGKASAVFPLIVQPDFLDGEEAEDDAEEKEAGDLGDILKLVRTRTGVDFTHYKKNTIRRRILRRMLLHKMETLPDYVAYLKKNLPEVKTLYNDLLINVTHFFRDPEANNCLKQELLPQLLKDRPKNQPLRVWVPACSTGEEVYTIAMLILEFLNDNLANTPVQIFGTDLSESAIAKARAAIYEPVDLTNVSGKRLQKYFSKIEGHYRVHKFIRDLCVFATHNVFKDPPFSRVDVVSCCNLLIYLETPLQKKVLANFHYSLNNDGYLILGQSETIGGSTALFAQTNKKAKVYSKKSDVSSRATFDMNYNFPAVEPASFRTPKSQTSATDVSKSQPPPGTNLDRIIDSVMLTRYTPAGVVLTHSLDIVQFRGSLSLYLEHSSGQASLNVLKMARPGLVLELRNAAHKVIKTGIAEKKSGIDISYQGSIHVISFEIVPLQDLANEPLMLVVFEEEKNPVTADAKTTHSKDRRVKQLEDELLALREDMRSIVEQQETANEELQSANEEIVSSNEELQSINEELETSKEELESSNEELQTINQELLVRNDQLAESQDYSQGIIATIREAVLVLDNNLRVKAANKAFYNTFKVSESDTDGKWVYNLCNNNFNTEAMKKLLEENLPRNGHVNGYRIEQTFNEIGEKVLMLNVRKMERKHPHPPIILIAIEDMTEHVQAENLLEEREAWLRNMTNNVPVMIWVAGPDKNFTFLNNTWLAFTGRTLTKETGIGWTEGVYPEDLELCLSTYHKAFQNRTPFSIEYRMKRHDGHYRWILNSAVPTYDSSGEFTGYTGSCTEIHDKRIMHQELEQRVHDRTQQLQEANNSLERSNNELQQFAYVASHDLQEPLRKIITFSNRLKENFADQMPAAGKEYIEKIHASTSRMRHLIDDLLNFSRISQFEKKFVQTDLNEVLRNVLADFDLLAQENNVNLNIGKLPVVPAVPLQIHQLFHNLVSNAFKFTAKKTNPHIEVASRILPAEELKRYPRLEPSVEYHEIVFRDNGIGFPQEFADQIFVIFQRLHDKDAYSGTGIGLALCRKIARNHMGEIVAESVENIGSAFSVILPASQTSASNK